MSKPPLLSLRGVRIGFGGRPLFEGLDLAVAAGDRVGLVGRNGAGKSTLLRLLSGALEPDAGDRVAASGVRVATLAQDPRLDGELTALAHVQRDAAAEHRALALLDRLGVDPAARLGTLSGGQARRVALARALASEPDVLLLDEPTNHLDLPSIQWLESEVGRFRGAVIIISHDRAFLRATTNAVVWLRRGRALRTERGFAHFDEFAEQVEQAEQAELNRIEEQVRAEERYAQFGVTARRRRNQRRVAKLASLRRERTELLRGRNALELQGPEVGRSGRVVIRAEGLRHAFGPVRIVDGFDVKILRGDRVGIIGPNGAGKSTLLRLLTGALPPDEGAVQLGTHVEIAYFDQHREQLDPDATLWKTLAPEGGDQVLVGGRPKHVVGYLKEFLFDAHQAHSPVHTLSGGERNRLLLAKLFSSPASLLVLDEPTNDLDMETLDLLEEVLSDFEGTLILVSHDRDFLDRLVTSVIAVEGDADVQEYAGGYSDYVEQRARSQAPAPPKPAGGGRPDSPPAEGAARPPSRPKLSYKQTRELEALPGQITEAQAELDELEGLLADPQGYARDPERFQTAYSRIDEVRQRKDALEERWLELEMIREASEA